MKDLEQAYLDHLWNNTSSFEKAFLAHHGILGQKWGIRRFQNKDGSLTNEGKKRYRVNTALVQPKIHKLFNDAAYDDDISEKVFDMLHADKKYLNEAVNSLEKNVNEQKQITNEVNKMFSDMRKNLHYYEAASELVECMVIYGDDVDNMTMDDLSSAGYMGVLEDGQQGHINAYSMYTSQHNLEEKIKELNAKSLDANRNARENAKEAINKAFEEVGAETLTASLRNDKYMASDGVVFHMMNTKRFDDWDDVNGSWYLNDASGAMTFTDKDKKNLEKAGKYISKIKNNNDANTWWYVYRAVDNLGFNDLKISDLSQSDWDRINKEISDLRSKDKNPLNW